MFNGDKESTGTTVRPQIVVGCGVIHIDCGIVHVNMDVSLELCNEELFKPDYFETVDESESTSVVASSTHTPASGECTTGKNITLKMLGAEQLPVSVTT